MLDPAYDLFVSYAHANGEQVAPAVSALRECGLKLFVDRAEIDDFVSITRSIRDALASSRAFLAFYSKLYPTRRACQWELTSAFLAAQRRGDPRERVLVINPEADGEHIQPDQLRDASYVGDSDVKVTAHQIAGHVRELSGSLKGEQSFPRPEWHGRPGIGSNRFAGRHREFWRLHSQLHLADLGLITGHYAPGYAQVRGMGGVGKSLLVEEYALRFSSAFPGGIFWLDAHGHDDRGRGLDREGRESERLKQIREFARGVGVRIHEVPASDLEGALSHALAAQELPYLWIVDDLPGLLLEDERRRWIAPNNIGRTIVTTRSREYGGAGAILDLGVLEPQDAYTLLTATTIPRDGHERKEAESIVRALGQHPLALDIAASALSVVPGEFPFSTFLNLMESSSANGLALAKDLSDQLPNGHERDIATTLLRSIDSLSSDGRDVLKIAAALPPVAIPDDLIVRAFQSRHRLLPQEAVMRVAAALSEVRKLSLAERQDLPTRAWSVHTLVSHAVRWSDSTLDQEIGPIVVGATLAALTQGQPQEAVLSLLAAHARKISRPVASREHAALAAWLANRDFAQGNPGSAEPLQDEALAFYRQMRTRDDAPALEEIVSVVNSLARTLCALGRWTSARALGEEWLAICEAELGANHPATLSVRHSQVATLRQSKDLKQAVLSAEPLCSILAEVLGAQHPVTLAGLHSLALALSDLGEQPGEIRGVHNARAIQIASDVLSKRRLSLGTEHPDSLSSMADLAAMHIRAGHLEVALPLFRDVLRARRRILGDEHFATLDARQNLAAALQKYDSAAEARVHFREILAAYDRLLGERNHRTATAAWNLFAVLVRNGELSEAQLVRQQYLDWLLELEAPGTQLFEIQERFRKVVAP